MWFALHNMFNLQDNTDRLGANIDKAKISNGWKILFERITSLISDKHFYKIEDIKFMSKQMVIYFISNKSFCQLCHKTFSSNRSLKIHIGRNHEALRCILNGIFKKNNFCSLSQIVYCLISKVLFLWGEYGRISFESVSMLNHCHKAAWSTDIVG